MLETISIAATTYGLHASYQLRSGLPDSSPTFDIIFTEAPSISPNPLAPYIPERTVQRRAMRTRSLTRQEKQQLEEAIGAEFQILWLESFTDRLRTARLTFKNAKLRLTLPEAYPVHRDIIEWNARYSESKIPDQAVGTDPVTTRLMHWTLQSWERVAFMNRYLAGTLIPRIELDLIPGIACAAHFVLLAEHKPESILDYVAAGRSVQRFWLTASQLGLCLQPEMTPLIFNEYNSDNIPFSATTSMNKKAQEISSQLQELIGENEANLAVFMGRIGASINPRARSIRLPLEQLLT